MSSILDLKNQKKHSKNNHHSINDLLDGDSPIELDGELIPIEPTKKTVPPVSNNPKRDDDFFEKLETPEVFDRNEEVPNNAGDMAPLATLTSTPQFPLSGPELFNPEFIAGPIEKLVAWTSPDKHHELISHTLRKWVVVVLVVMAFLAFFWQGSILTAITFFTLALVTLMHFWREAVHHQYEIHPHGILVGEKFYHYHDLDSFWIHYHPEGYHELSLCTGELLNHYVKIPLKGQDPFQVRDALMMYLPEERHEEGLEDWLRRELGL